MLQLRNSSFLLGSNLIWQNISFIIHSKEVISFVRKNGCGKSSLLKIITGEYELTSDTIIRHKAISIGYLSQEVSSYGLHQTVDQYLFSAFTGLCKTRQAIQSDPTNANIWNDFEELGGFKVKTMSNQYSKKLTFSQECLQWNRLLFGTRDSPLYQK